jgi:hypothetical protein
VLYTYLVRIAGRCLIGISAMFDGRMGPSVCCRGTSERMLLMKDVVGGSWTEEASARAGYRHLSFQDSIVDLGGYKRPRLAEEETSVSSAGRLGLMPQQSGRTCNGRTDGVIVSVDNLHWSTSLDCRGNFEELVRVGGYIVVRHGVEMSVNPSQVRADICYN